jgi:hypothetical protein
MNAITGLLYKKVMNTDGTVKQSIPYLLRTWAGLVFTDSGSTVQSELDTLNSKKPHLVYTTVDAYLADFKAGKVSSDTLVVIDPDYVETNS